MKLLEYQAKAVFDAFSIPTMNGCVIDNLDHVEETIEKAGLTYPVVVKCQVQIGGRGKAGGIQFADNPEEAQDWSRKLLGKDIRGLIAKQLLIVEKSINKQEWYLSIMLDRLSKCPIIIFSAMGGMDIEETAKTDPDKIIKIELDPFRGVEDFHVRYLLSQAKLPMTYFDKMSDLLKKLYEAFSKQDCMLCEINPLVVNDKDELIALDGKIDVDDSALFRLPEIAKYQADEQIEPLVKEAREHDFLYIPIEEGGSIAVTSNGSGMLMSCIDLISKEGMKVGAALDLGGGATAERIKEAMRILFSTPGIKAVLINIFGGITRCDEVAGGVKLMMESGQIDDKIVVIRMEGTNKDKGLEIISNLKGDIVSVPGLRESVKALLERRDRL